MQLGLEVHFFDVIYIYSSLLPFTNKEGIQICSIQEIIVLEEKKRILIVSIGLNLGLNQRSFNRQGLNPKGLHQKGLKPKGLNSKG